ncbi:MAG: GDP-mannose 4,6-dehydratase [Acidimicrobiales bacterium]
MWDAWSTTHRSSCARAGPCTGGWNQTVGAAVPRCTSLSTTRCRRSPSRPCSWSTVPSSGGHGTAGFGAPGEGRVPSAPGPAQESPPQEDAGEGGRDRRCRLRRLAPVRGAAGRGPRRGGHRLLHRLLRARRQGGQPRGGAPAPLVPLRRGRPAHRRPRAAPRGRRRRGERSRDPGTGAQLGRLRAVPVHQPQRRQAADRRVARHRRRPPRAGVDLLGVRRRRHRRRVLDPAGLALASPSWPPSTCCGRTGKSFGLPLTILRYFSIYGPRQRPDMAYRIFCERLLRGEPITVYGDGEQSRSNTYVADCVAATIAALERPGDGAIVNVGGGREITLREAIAILAAELGVEPTIEHRPARKGDQRRTVADTTRAKELLGWSPTVAPEEGLAEQVRWVRERAADA